MSTRTAEKVAEAARRLTAAGVPSARHDAESLAAHVLGVSRSQLVATSAPLGAGFEELVARRAAREPLQHLLGSAPFRHLELAVGPGVFVPRPESELVVEPVLALLAAPAAPPGAVVVDLCAGSGALGLAVAAERPGTRVHAVESSLAAFRWLQANAAARAAAGDLPVRCHLADARTLAAPEMPLRELVGTVDGVVTNPPYLPEGLRGGLEPEVGDWDPPEALFAGRDGLQVARELVGVAARLLRPGGVLSMEHGEDQQQAVLSLLGGPAWAAREGRRDLAGRPRFVVAVRS